MKLTSDDLVAVVDQGAGQSSAVGENLHLIGLELWGHGLFECYSNTCQSNISNIPVNKRAGFSGSWNHELYLQWRGCEALPAAPETQPG